MIYIRLVRRFLKGDHQTESFAVGGSEGNGDEIPKAQIVANTTGGGTKSTPMRLKVTATVLVPTTSGGVNMPPIYYTEPSS